MTAWQSFETLEKRQLLSGGGLDRNFGGGDGVLEFQDGDGVALAFDSSGRLLTRASGNAVMRLKPNGDVDTSFGEGGKLNIGFNVSDIVVRADGKIVLGGSGGNRWVVARFNPDWTPDASFGKAGKASVPAPGDLDQSWTSSMAVFPDGDVVLGGSFLQDDSWDDDETISNPAVVRFNADGSPDRDFGDDGTVKLHDNFSSSTETVLATHDGNVIAMGHTWSGGHSNWPWIVELDETGNGTRNEEKYGPELPENFGDYAGGTVRPDGAVVIASNTSLPPRLVHIDGKPSQVDFSPGSDPDGISGAVTSDAANRVIVAGQYWVDGKGVIGVQRLTKDGLPDKSFGTNGSASAPLSYDVESVNTVAVAPDGDIVVGAYDETAQRSFLVRFDAQGTPQGTRRKPTAALRSPANSPVRPNRGSRKMVVTVLYSAERYVTRASLDDLDVVVRGPNGFKANALFKDFTNTPEGRLVEYLFQAPGKRWDAKDNGKYRIAIRRDQVRDNFGAFVEPATIGRFRVEA